MTTTRNPKIDNYQKQWFGERTCIFIKKETKKRLKNIDHHNESFDTLINELLDVWDIVRKEWQQQQTKQ